MIEVEKIRTWGFEHAIRGMRNPLNSWNKSDSFVCDAEMTPECSYCEDRQTGRCADGFILGGNDFTLMQKLYAGGQPHRKYLRQIFVAMDITAPLYWWKEFDTYKVGTTANSCSTMHKIAAKPFQLDDFSFDHLYYDSIDCLDTIIHKLNEYRKKFNETKKKGDWWQMIQLLPSSYNQLRTVTMTYENVMNMLDYRQGHKLGEWNEFCEILLELPYVAELRDSKGGQR